MEENQINEVLKKYEKYLQNSNADVAHTSKGVWFFFEHSDGSDNYLGNIICFKTAEELEQIIISSMAGDMACEIDNIVENIHYNIYSMFQEMGSDDYCVNCIPRLTGYLDIISNEYKSNIGKIEFLSEQLKMYAPETLKERLQKHTLK